MDRTLLSSIFADQFGLVTADQARGSGFSSRQLNHLVGRRELSPVHDGVYRHPAFPRSVEQRQLAAVLACGPGAAISHRTAATIIGLRNVATNIIEVARPHPGLIRLEGVFVHRIPDLRPSDIEIRNGIPTTTAARTLVDLGLVTSPAFVERALEAWSINGLVSVGEVEQILNRVARQGRNGVRSVRRALEHHNSSAALADSVPEGRLLTIAVRYSLALPTLHHLVTTSAGSTFELDWSYPDRMIAIEIDGFGVHLRSRQAFADDRLRQNELEIDGWQVLRFAAATVNFRPDIVGRQVRAALVNRLTPPRTASPATGAR